MNTQTEPIVFSEGGYHLGKLERNDRGEITFCAHHVSSSADPYVVVIQDLDSFKAMFEAALAQMGGDVTVKPELIVHSDTVVYHFYMWSFGDFCQLNVHRGWPSDLRRFKQGHFVGASSFCFSPLYPYKLNEIIELLSA